MSSASFKDKPEPAFDKFLLTSHTTHWYVPIASNFMIVDGAILLLNHASKNTTIITIQFMISQRHKQLDEGFHKRLWSIWIKLIVSVDFSVDSIFVWIDTKQLSEHFKLKAVKAL